MSDISKTDIVARYNRACEALGLHSRMHLTPNGWFKISTPFNGKAFMDNMRQTAALWQMEARERDVSRRQNTMA